MNQTLLYISPRMPDESERFLNNIDPDSNYFNSYFDSIASQNQSNYININDYTSFRTTRNFTIMSYNIRSYNANSDSFFPCSQTIAIILNV